MKKNIFICLPTDVKNPHYNLKLQSLKLHNLLYKRNFNTELELSIVSRMDISSNTLFEQPRVARKPLTQLAKTTLLLWHI